MRHRAVQMYLDGTNFRRVGRLLGVNHQSVVNWVKEYHDKAQTKQGFPHENESVSAYQSQPHDERTGTASLDVVEGDEIFTFIGNKKKCGVHHDMGGAQKPVHYCSCGGDES